MSEGVGGSWSGVTPPPGLGPCATGGSASSLMYSRVEIVFFMKERKIFIKEWLPYGVCGCGTESNVRIEIFHTHSIAEVWKDYKV